MSIVIGVGDCFAFPFPSIDFSNRFEDSNEFSCTISISDTSTHN